MALYDIAIIGGGVAGFACAMYAGRFNLKTAVFSPSTGGTIILTDIVENYPGFESITGLELAEKIQKHAEKFGAETIESKVEKIEKNGNNWKLVTDSGQDYESKTIVFATGTEWRKLNVPGEKEYSNRGVHYCALCDGALYQNKAIAVVGGGDSAVKEANLLTQWASKVFVIYRGEKLRGEPVNMKKLESNKKIEIIYNTNILEIRGDGKKVDGIVLDSEYDNSNELKLDAVFVEIGHIPLSNLAKWIGVNLNGKGEIIIDREAKTNIPGVYAAGDVGDLKFKQAITGVAEGVSAAYSAYQYIEENNA